MDLRMVLTAAFLGLTACATPGPEPTETAATAHDPAPLEATAATTTDDDTAIATVGEGESTDESDLPVVTGGQARDDLVCRLERRTGSNRAKRVCRTRASLAQDRIKAKEAFESLRRSQDGNN